MAHPLDGRGLFIEFCDFEQCPIGGQLNFARQMKKGFGSELAYLGYGLPGENVGEWTWRGVDRCPIFAVSGVPEWGHGRLLPLRIRAVLAFLRNVRRLRQAEFGMVFVQSPEALLCSKFLRKRAITYRFAGTNNPIRHSRFRGWRWMSVFYERVMKTLLRDVDLILVTAERSEVARIEKWLSAGTAAPKKKVEWFPTRVDTDVFSRIDVKREIAAPRLIFVGRLNRGKGCRLLLESFVRFRSRYPDSSLTIVGDGEDRGAIESIRETMHLYDCVRLTGSLGSRDVANELSRAHIFVFPSEREGWPTALLEAVAVGLFPVTANVSGCGDIFEPPEEGCVVEGRSPDAFAEAIENAWLAINAGRFSPADISPFASSKLRVDLEALWQTCRT